MMNDDLINLYLDGELDPVRRADVERRLASDSGAAARLQRFEATDDMLRAAMPALQHSNDAALAAMLVETRVEARRALGKRWEHMGALAAAMLLGLLVGRFLNMVDDPRTAPYAVSAVEAQLLDTLVSGRSVSTSEGVVEISMSLQTDAGRFCRQYTLSDAQAAVAVLACKDAGGAWGMEIAAPHVAVAGYVLAGGSAVDEALHGLGPAVALDAEEEADMIRRGWR